MQNFEQVLAAVHRAAVMPALICIDGPAGAGKTTLATMVASELSDALVIHMDDLYEGWNSPLDNDLFDRVLADIIEPLKAGLPLTFRTWNWASSGWNHPTTVAVPMHLILEGVGACARSLREQATISVYVDIDDERGIERVNERDGLVSEPHMALWLKDQRAYFAADNTSSECDLKLRASE